jgi:hypothetical protein
MKTKSAPRSPLCKLRVLICLALLCTTSLSAHATTITVTNTNDSGPGSLRQALADASDGDTIDFAVTGTIGLTSGELLVDKSVIVSGPGAAILAVDGDTTSRVFHIGPGKTVSISGLTVAHGSTASGIGGGILNDHATLTILSSTISGNFAYSAGGGIYNDASNGGSVTLTIMNSTVDSNGAAHDDIPYGGGEGGGIYNGGGTLTITNSVVSNNYAGVSGKNFPVGTGGGIFNYGTLTITASAITSNHVYLTAGGIYNEGTATITSSTISDNAAVGEHDGEPWGTGGGIEGGTVTLTNSTVSGNGANLADGGILCSGTITNSTISGNNGSISVGTGTLEIVNTILNASAGSSNITNYGGTITSHGYNVSSDDGGGYLAAPGDQINTDPLLGPLQDNGGLTITHALLPGSPAVNAGDPNFTPPPSYDQRGSPFVRVFNGRIDIGSFEVQPPRRPRPAPRSRPTPPPRPTPR